MSHKNARHWLSAAAALVLAGGAFAVAKSADHRDSALLTASPAEDIADVYTFRSPANPDNLVLAMTVSGFLPPTEVGMAFFDPSVLYQFKIDTDGDAVEDRVIQAHVTGLGTNQVMHVRGPAAPEVSGATSRILRGAETATVRVSAGAESRMASRGGLTVFAGLRDDPFFFDLGQFRRILGGQATGFTNPGTDAFAGFNVLAIVIELPASMLGSSTLGVWGTTSKAIN